MSVAGSSLDTALSPRDELRSKLVALASHHGIALVSRRDRWDACEIDLRSSFSGHDREIYAAVAALRHGIVADLVAWRVDGATRIERELTRRLSDRAGVEPELARWAIDAWAGAFKVPLDASVEETAPYIDERSALAGMGRGDIVIRARHFVLLGAFAGLAVAVSVVSGSLTRFLAPRADSAAAAPAPMTKRVPQAMASRSGRSGRTGRNAERRRSGSERAATVPERRLAEGVPERDADDAPTTGNAEDSRRQEVSLGDIATRMPPTDRSNGRDERVRLTTPEPSLRATDEDPESIRRAFGMAAPPAAASPAAPTPARPSGPAVPAPSASSTVRQAGTPDDEPSCGARRPRLVRNAEPELPGELQDRGISSGRVVVRFRVDDDGFPEPGSARVVESSNPALNANALAAVERLRYQSARETGCRGGAVMERTIRFF
jgi:TonB family protein